MEQIKIMRTDEGYCIGKVDKEVLALSKEELKALRHYIAAEYEMDEPVPEALADPEIGLEILIEDESKIQQDTDGWRYITYSINSIEVVDVYLHKGEDHWYAVAGYTLREREALHEKD